MTTVAEMIEELKKFPPDAKCYAYEGERTCLVIVSDASPREQLGYIEAFEAYDD